MPNEQADVIQRDYIAKISLRNMIRTQQNNYNAAVNTGALAPVFELLKNTHDAYDAQFNDVSVPAVLKGADLVQLRANKAAIKMTLNKLEDPWSDRLDAINTEIKEIRDNNGMFLQNIDPETGAIIGIDQDEADRSRPRNKRRTINHLGHRELAALPPPTDEAAEA